MRFKKCYLLSLVLVAGGYLLPGCNNMPKPQKKVVKTPAKTEYILQPITVQNDTVDIDTTNLFNDFSAGVFIAHNNKIIIRYFNPVCDDSSVIRFCQRNNDVRDLTYIHEQEHARKAIMTNETSKRSPYIRAQLAAMNEIMAPAAEIIGALEYHCKYGEIHPSIQKEIAEADSAIMNIKNTSLSLNKVDFNNPQVADLVMHYATKKFLKDLNRGFYRNTINKAAEKIKTNYKPNEKCDMSALLTFAPELGMWAPMWQYNTSTGPINIWNSATWLARKRLMEVIDSVIEPAVGDQILFYKPKIR